MKYYIELTAIPMDGIPVYIILGKMMEAIHKCIITQKENGSKDIYAVSFPEYTEKYIGRKIRVFANSVESLQRFNIHSMLNSILDYVHITSIRTVPNNIQYAIFKRVQINSRHHMAKYYAKNYNVSYEDAYKQICIRHPNKLILNLPFIQLYSYSTKQKMPLFIKKIKADKPALSNINSYGLNNMSCNCTVPIF